MRMTTIQPEHVAAVQQNAVEFTKFDAALSVRYDAVASATLKAKYWRILTAFKYYVGSPDSDVWVYIPAGYLSDGATVPRPLWWLLTPWGKYGQDAVVHDRLCETLQVYCKGEVVSITRAKADSIFREAMKASGVNPLTRNVMYWSVRAYARLFHKNKPTVNIVKDELEAQWKG